MFLASEMTNEQTFSLICIAAKKPCVMTPEINYYQKRLSHWRELRNSEEKLGWQACGPKLIQLLIELAITYQFGFPSCAQRRIFVVVLLSIFTEPEMKWMNTILRMTKEVHIFILYFGGFPYSVIYLNIYVNVNTKLVTNKLVRVLS